MRSFHIRYFRGISWLLLLCMVLAAPGCNLSAGPQVIVATTTPVPSVLTVPLASVNPVYGPPGTTVTLTTAGFAAGTQLNVFVSSPDIASSTPLTVATANADITIIMLPLPQQINGTAVASGTPLLFTVTSASSGASATALFWVQGPSVITITATPGGQAVPTTQGNGATTGVFITAPPINSAVDGSSVAVTGSAPAGPVTVQVQDANNAVLGSATASSQATAGTLGVWQATVTFTPQAAGATGFIVAIQGNQQASIPVIFSGGPAVTPGTAAVPVPTLVFATPSPSTPLGAGQ